MQSFPDLKYPTEHTPHIDSDVQLVAHLVGHAIVKGRVTDTG